MPTSDFADDPLLAILAVLEQSWLNLEVLPHLGRHFHLPCKQVLLKRLPETSFMIFVVQIYCGFCLNRILHYFPMLVSVLVCQRRDISSFHDNLIV